MRAMLRGIACVCSPNLSTFYSICAKPIHCTSWFHKSSSDSSNGSLNVDFCRVCCLVRFRLVLALKFLSWFDICACISAVPTKDSIDSLFFDLSALAAIFFSLSFLKFPSCCFHFSFHSRVWTFSKLPLADWSVSYAALICRNCSTDSGESFTSGWYLFALRLYARLTASWLAPTETPKIKYNSSVDCG